MTPKVFWDFTDNLWEPRIIEMADGGTDEHLRMIWSPHGPVIGIVQLCRADVEKYLGPLVAAC